MPKKISLLAVAALMVIGMLKLGVWQLNRADHKMAILSQLQQGAAEKPVDLSALVTSSGLNLSTERFRAVKIVGSYASDKSVYIDNQVLGSQVGYTLLTPFRLSNSDWWVLVDRGWLPVGVDRGVLPQFITQSGEHGLIGRLNTLPSIPPLWNDKYPAATGKVWQYLPIEEFSQKMGLKVLPLVVELAPDQASEIDKVLIRQWSGIDDSWVAKHKAYAFQWFAMAAAFFIACCVLLYRSSPIKQSTQL